MGGNAYRRFHSADQKLSDETVKRYLAEQVEDSRDNRILKGYYVSDINQETLRTYRQVYANLNPDAPWNGLDNGKFLEMIGGWRKNRETEEQGLTLAGLLMFGTHPLIQEFLPNYMLDYQERPEAKIETRWIDRVTLDGTWSGNLYDFYRKVYGKLTADLKIPFKLDGDQRQSETVLHVAIREALCNVLVHADYTDRASVFVVKRPDMFGFRNPGLMRIPPDIAIQGGHADCRNRLLHQMFRYIGVGEQSGSGIPKILDSWTKLHWRKPLIAEKNEPYDQTLLEMRMLNLFPDDIIHSLKGELGEVYDEIGYTGQIALAIARTEDTVSHDRLKDLVDEHPSDISSALHDLTARGLLEKTGSTRGAIYHVPGISMISPEDVFDSPHLAASSPHLAASSPHLTASSPHLLGNDTTRDSDGCLISEHFGKPIIDDIINLQAEFFQQLKLIAKVPSEKKRVPRAVIEQVIIDLCCDYYISLTSLAKLINRSPKALREQYLSDMVKEKKLKLAFPAKPNDPRQTYTASEKK